MPAVPRKASYVDAATDSHHLLQRFDLIDDKHMLNLNRLRNQVRHEQTSSIVDSGQ
jgi:hypothetical protein